MLLRTSSWTCIAPYPLFDSHLSSQVLTELQTLHLLVQPRLLLVFLVKFALNGIPFLDGSINERSVSLLSTNTKQTFCFFCASALKSIKSLCVCNRSSPSKRSISCNNLKYFFVFRTRSMFTHRPETPLMQAETRNTLHTRLTLSLSCGFFCEKS